MHNKIYEKIKQFIKSNYDMLIVIILILCLFYIKLPFVIYKSGGTIDLSKRVTSESIKKDTSGSIRMSYVTQLDGSIVNVLASFVLPDWDLKSKEEEFGDNYQDILKINKIYMNEGVDNAIISAFKYSNEEVTINKTIPVISGIMDNSKNNLVIGDELLEVNNTKVYNVDDIKDILNNLDNFTKVNIKVKNNNKTYNRYAYVISKDNEHILGVYISYKYEYTTSIPIKIKTKNSEYGSSGGLMMALSVYNYINDTDITHGLNIVGTGTIDKDGSVGKIDGIKYKLLGSKDADIFFVPSDNYKEAIKINKNKKLGIKIVKVDTLGDAINYLENLN